MAIERSKAAGAVGARRESDVGSGGDCVDPAKYLKASVRLCCIKPSSSVLLIRPVGELCWVRKKMSGNVSFFFFVFVLELDSNRHDTSTGGWGSDSCQNATPL